MFPNLGQRFVTVNVKVKVREVCVCVFYSLLGLYGVDRSYVVGRDVTRVASVQRSSLPPVALSEKNKTQKHTEVPRHSRRSTTDSSNGRRSATAIGL